MSCFDVQRAWRTHIVSLVLLIAGAAFTPCVWANTSGGAAEVETPHGRRPFGPSGDPAIDGRAQDLGRKLRCPVCQGMPINESPATMAVDMMQQVRKMLAEGQSDAAILDYFTSRYGQWVLLEPPHEGFALWIWILPPLCCLGLLTFAWRIVWRLRETRGAGPVTTPLHLGITPDPSKHVAQTTNDDDAEALLTAIRQEVDLP